MAAQSARRVLRVNQLDAAQLDEEIIHLLRSQLNKAFQFFKAGVLTKFEAELNMVLRFLVWRFSVYSSDSSVGQQLLNMTYRSTGSCLTVIQKLLLGFSVVGIPYLKDRSSEIQRIINKFTDFSTVSRCVYVGEKLLQASSVLNFLIFLQKGKYPSSCLIYPSLLERFLGIHPVFAKQQSIRQVSFEYMTRELLWHGFAEFLFFLLPLINIHKLKNIIVRQFLSPSSFDKQSSIKLACHECGICWQPPTAPHQGQCGHVFCYYCIKGNSLADWAFPCPLCGAAVGGDITPVECTVALEVT